MIKHALRILWVCLMIGSSLPAFAQFTSGVEGTVKDSSGALIPGATVSITNVALGVTKTATSNPAGYFRVDGIAASTYRVEIKMQGFRTWVQTQLVLQVGEVRTVSPVLEIGQVSTVVNVSATQAAVDLASATSAAVVDNETIKEIPLPGQSVFR
jgi:hypothetical protein